MIVFICSLWWCRESSRCLNFRFEISRYIIVHIRSRSTPNVSRAQMPSILVDSYWGSLRLLTSRSIECGLVLLKWIESSALSYWSSNCGSTMCKTIWKYWSEIIILYLSLRKIKSYPEGKESHCVKSRYYRINLSRALSLLYQVITNTPIYYASLRIVWWRYFWAESFSLITWMSSLFLKHAVSRNGRHYIWCLFLFKDLIWSEIQFISLIWRPISPLRQLKDCRSLIRISTRKCIANIMGDLTFQSLFSSTLNKSSVLLSSR